jgi:hypothetical protein
MGGRASDVLDGALAGVVATAAMTAAMWRLHQALPPAERYPLPPRELVEPLLHGAPDGRVKDATLAAHFGFGALAGAGIAAASPRLGRAGWAAAGLAVWAGSYLGWAPAFFGLRPASGHPARRNALMAAAHLVWGAAAALTLGELRRARATMLASGPLCDRRSGTGAGRRRSHFR